MTTKWQMHKRIIAELRLHEYFLRGLKGAKLRRTQSEQMSSGLALTTDIARCNRHVSNVPDADVDETSALSLPPGPPSETVDQLHPGTYGPHFRYKFNEQKSHEPVRCS
jgi:hypothetical protein